MEDFAAGEDEDISKKIMMSINWVISEGSLAPILRPFSLGEKDSDGQSQR